MLEPVLKKFFKEMREMFKRTIAAMLILAVTLCAAVKVDAADTRNKQDDTWLIYWYICGADNLEGDSNYATKDIAEMQRVKLPPNVKVLIAAGSTQKWHHPTIKDGGHGIYLYSSNHFEKQVDWNTNPDQPDTNMGDPDTLESFLRFGEEHFDADHKVIIFWDHGGLSGVCYDDSFKGDGLLYDELKSAFAAVYGDSPEEIPFELIGFKACLTGSYELANSLADFSHYMLGSEPSVYAWNFSDWIAALAEDTSMNGAQLGKVICDSAMNSYNAVSKRTHTFSLIDLRKMPELRTAYENYFDEALKRSNEETGFSGAFARAAENRNVDKYSNLYVDLGLLAKNTKSIMPKESNALLKAIDKAVVYNKRGAYLKSKGMSTYYPYISAEKVFSETGSRKDVESMNNSFDYISKQNSSYSAQKELYENLLYLDLSNLEEENTVPIERRHGHLVAKLTPEQSENISSVKCMLFPLNRSGQYDLGGALLVSADDLKIDWKKGIVTENFRAVEPMLDGRKIVMFPSVSGRGHTFYSVPVLVGDSKVQEHLRVRYDTSAKKYEIVGLGDNIENGVVRGGGSIKEGTVITPLYVTISTDPSDEILGLTGYARFNAETKQYENVPLTSIITGMNIPNADEKLFLKWKTGEPFVYTRNSAVTNKPIIKGDYFYLFGFSAPNGDSAGSAPGVIMVRNGKVSTLTTEEYFKLLAAVAQADK